MKMTLYPGRKPGYLNRPLGTAAAAGLSLLGLILAGCSITPPDTRARFHGTDQASVVLQYNSPEYIFMTSPSYREDGFLRQIRRPEVARVMDEMRVPRELAVVSLPWQLEGEVLRAVLADWKVLFQQSGFRHFVFVRTWDHTSVEGGIIIEEGELTSSPLLAAQTRP